MAVKEGMPLEKCKYIYTTCDGSFVLLSVSDFTNFASC